MSTDSETSAEAMQLRTQFMRRVQAQDTEINLRGASQVAQEATAVVLTSENPEDENSLTEPNKVAPQTQKITIAGAAFRHIFPPHSVTILRMPAR